MKKKHISVALATALLAAAVHNAHADDQQTSDNKQRQYIGTGIGAAAGAVVAGPVGLIVGGVIGNLAARHDATTTDTAEQTPVANEPDLNASIQPDSTAPTEDETAESIIVAQAGVIESVIEDDSVEHAPDLKEILVKDVELDIFFLSGSTAVESFYQPRLQAVAKIMQQLPDIDIHLEGYSDRRGDEDTNMELSNQRLDSVRNELVQAGIDTNRIHMSAFGELQFVSTPGDLEAYAFDRRVVIRFQQPSGPANKPIASVENSTAL
jgi:sortase system peptidoglycan-associated protein